MEGFQWRNLLAWSLTLLTMPPPATPTLPPPAQLSTTALSCGTNGVRATISFTTYSGQVLGVNTAAIGQSGLSPLLEDPLESQYSLTLKSVRAHMVLPSIKGSTTKTADAQLPALPESTDPGE